MITREDYLNALELIDQYHQQSNLSDKTLIEKWDKLNECSVRLKNVLEHFEQIRSNGQIDYIEDITERSFLMQRNAGKKTWDEFLQLRN